MPDDKPTKRPITGPAPRWAGFVLDRPHVMGILNVTADSFSDAGCYLTAEAAVEAGRAMAGAGADIIDVGGESTRPGASETPPAIEQARVIPVIRALAETGCVVSVDTRHAATMAAALDAGARIVNDVSGLAHDPASAPLVAARGCPVVLMHMRGTPATMASLARYADVVSEVASELSGLVAAALAAGIRRELIVLDPGFGFAKNPAQSVALLRDLPRLRALGFPLLAGLSRKGVIGALSGEREPAQRTPGSLAAGLWAVANGASILRVHDVAETVQALRVWHAIETAL
ncbi:MAG: dihydropteroate synthase [Acetobacteraceae bacterium]|nr:dihydropteroate synthase [Acetobacteraceae bacterium]